MCGPLMTGKLSNPFAGSLWNCSKASSFLIERLCHAHSVKWGILHSTLLKFIFTIYKMFVR